MTPSEVVLRYLDLLEARAHEAAWALLCEADRRARKRDAYVRTMNALPAGTVPARRIGEVSTEGDRATVEVLWDAPDPAALEQLREQARAGAISPEEFLRRMNDGDLPRGSRSERYDLVREPDGWRVVHGFRGATPA